MTAEKDVQVARNGGRGGGNSGNTRKKTFFFSGGVPLDYSHLNIKYSHLHYSHLKYSELANWFHILVPVVPQLQLLLTPEHEFEMEKKTFCVFSFFSCSLEF